MSSDPLRHLRHLYVASYHSNPTGFNIWSACRYSMGFAEQPALNDWMLACKNASVDLPGAQALSSEPDGLGFKVPTWALVSAPGGKYFDMQSATRSKQLFCYREYIELTSWFTFSSCASWNVEARMDPSPNYPPHYHSYRIRLPRHPH